MQATTFLLFVLVAAIGGAPSENRISGGIAEVPPDSSTDPYLFPYIVSIQEKDEHICGGYIYSPRWIVTAASCVEGKTISTLVIVAGQLNLIDLEEFEVHVPVFRIFPNDLYNVTGAGENDLALLELASDILLDGVHTYNIDFNEVDIDVPVPLTGAIMGWGETSLGGAPSAKLRSGEVEMTEGVSSCGSFSGDEFKVLSMICAIPSGTPPTPPTLPTTPCTKDKGGPLVQTISGGKTIAVGVLSRPDDLCDGTGSAIYTRLSAFYAWIYRTAGQPYGTTTAPGP